MKLARCRHPLIGINEATLAVELQDGIGRLRTLRFDTDQAHAEGTGDIDLGSEAIHVPLRSQRKRAAIVALPSAIRLHGSLQNPELSLARRSGAAS